MTREKAGQLVSLSDHLVLRIRFKSGAVSEERGCDKHIEELFAQDEQGLIDYVLGYDPVTQAFDMWVADGDPNWTDEEIERLFGA